MSIRCAYVCFPLLLGWNALAFSIFFPRKGFPDTFYTILKREEKLLIVIWLYPLSLRRHKRPLNPPISENIYENVPARRGGPGPPGSSGRPSAPLPPVPLPKKMGNGTAVPLGHAAVAPKNPSLVNTTLQDQRLRGVSVDRYREYQTPQYYEDTYYTREENERRVTVKHVDHQPLTNGRLERHASHPNLRPRPSTAGGRRLPKTPNQPPGTIIVIENVVGNAGGRSGRTLPDVKRATSSATNTIGTYTLQDSKMVANLNHTVWNFFFRRS